MTDQVISLPTIEANLSPEAFHRTSYHFYKCFQDFESPDSFSPLPFFLLCRAIELRLKSLHLQSLKQSRVKSQFGHNLVEAYRSLQLSDQHLDSGEFNTLIAANAIYQKKGFEYFVPEDALSGYSRYPDLRLLDAIARKLNCHVASP
ncbi:hypothetical protein [Tautonia marina]|uniref:hypothetical protein n=1 Tax=Tautonia marina TaxID=2653855 RepID=UPI0012609C57|nr:hypothetical protein [Tautonia marina]